MINETENPTGQDGLQTNQNAGAEQTEGQPQKVEATPENSTEPARKPRKAAVAEAEPVIETAHDDFDWTLGKRDIKTYTDEQREELEKSYDGTLQTVEENEIVKGTVVGLTSSDVVLNIGFKSDGLVPLSEFRDIEGLKRGDEVEVYVVEKENINGQLVLSRKSAKLFRAWENIVGAYEKGDIVNGVVTSKTKGGLIVNVFGLETFLPGSQIDVKPIVDYDAYVGKKMEFKVVKINEAIKNAVVSHKALIESDIESQRQDIMSKLDVGQVLEGTVKNITDFGAFIDLGGVDGLLYITDISWGRINHPSELLELNQKLNVVVLSFDNEKKRISLGLKQLLPHPWDVLDQTLEVGGKIKGKVVNIEDYGAFLEVIPGVEGLIHVSEVSWSNHPINSKEFFKLSENHEAIVMTLDREDRKMSLSIKRLLPDPWEQIADKYPVGSKHTGKVQNITPYGVFVEMEEGIGGMVHVSDLSWTKRYAHPSEFTKVGADIEVVVLGIDITERKMTLGHKQLEEDPWDTFETIFPVGAVHEGTIIKREDNGGIVLLPYGLEGFAPNRHLRKEDGKFAEADETLSFKVIEFDRKDKKIILSHSKYVEDLTQGGDSGKDEDSKKRTSERKSAGKSSAAAMNKKMEKTTLGDIDVLSDLKTKMEKSEKGGTAKAETVEEPVNEGAGAEESITEEKPKAKKAAKKAKESSEETEDKTEE